LSEPDRKRAIELLQANHVFPGDYTVSVIAVNDDAVAQAVVAAAQGPSGQASAPPAHEVRPSSQGKYVSHRLTVRCEDAEEVLALYARLRAVKGVITVL
jgi:putative lipoic acid-binding regulatory protein